MKYLQFRYEMKLLLDAPISNHSFALRCMPRTDDLQKIEDAQLKVTTDGPEGELPVPLGCCPDGFGNIRHTGRIRQSHRLFAFELTGRAHVDRLAGGCEELQPVYKFPSKLTAYGAPIEEFLSSVPLDGQNAYMDAQRLMHRLYEVMHYVPGSTHIGTTACEALAAGEGVCQDYAHILTALCRGAGIPARYVSGLMIGEGFSHAWMEVYDGSRWQGLDPTNDLLIDDYYVKLAHGRDFTDCEVDRGLFTGAAQQKQEIFVSVQEIEGGAG